MFTRSSNGTVKSSVVYDSLVWGEDWAGDTIWDLSTNTPVKEKNKAWDPMKSTSTTCKMEISALGGEELCLALLLRQDSESMRKRIEVWLWLQYKKYHFKLLELISNGIAHFMGYVFWCYKFSGRILNLDHCFSKFYTAQKEKNNNYFPLGG